MTRLVECHDCKQLMVPHLIDHPITCEEPLEASDYGYCRLCYPKHKMFQWDHFVELDESFEWAVSTFGPLEK